MIAHEARRDVPVAARRPLFVATLCAALACSSVALGQSLCLTTPKPVPGLPGAPDWHSGTPQARADLGDPRWGAAFWRTFDAGGVGDMDAGYRILYDPASHALVVSVHALNDGGLSLSDNDEVFFGITTGDTTASARGVRIIPTPIGAIPSAGSDPKAATRFRRMEYTTGSWTYLANAVDDDNIVPSPTPPPWLLTPNVWSAAGAPADWAINFRVDLAALGIANGSTHFRVALGIHIQNEAVTPPGPGLEGYTPAGGSIAAYSDLFGGSNVASWAQVSGAATACPDAIVIDRYAFGIQDPADAAGGVYGTINTTLGAVNRFKAMPSYPPLTPAFINFAGLLEANFRIANWGSVADPAAAWPVIENGEWVDNGANGAAVSDFAFDCPPNDATGVCGMPITSSGSPGFHQCIQVELRERPGAGGTNYPVVFNPSSVYRNTYFAALSDFRHSAEINVKGLSARLGNSEPRTVYLQVQTRNMPPHGNDPVWLNARQMRLSRERVTRRGELAGDHRLKPPSKAELQRLKKEAAARAKAAAAAGGDEAAKKAQAAKVDGPPPEPVLTPDQRLDQSWPTYRVHVYYSLGKQTHPNGSSYERLHAMYPFQYRFEHDGSLYGFTHALGGDGATLERLGDDFYKLVIPNEGTAHVSVHVTAEEARKTPPTPEPPHVIEVEKVIIRDAGGCGSCSVGATGATPRRLGMLFAVGVLLALPLRRLRRRRR